MKLIALTLLLALPSCAVNPVTGKQTISPEFSAALNRIGASALNAAEIAISAKIHEALRVRAQK